MNANLRKAGNTVHLSSQNTRGKKLFSNCRLLIAALNTEASYSKINVWATFE